MKSPESKNVGLTKAEKVYCAVVLVGTGIGSAYVGDLMNQLAVYDYLKRSPLNLVAIEGFLSFTGYTMAIGCEYYAYKTLRSLIASH